MNIFFENFWCYVECESLCHRYLLNILRKSSDKITIIDKAIGPEFSSVQINCCKENKILLNTILGVDKYPLDLALFYLSIIA